MQLVYAVVCNDPAKEKEKIIESGVDKVAKKPVDIMKLLDIVQKLWDVKPNNRRSIEC
jgi:hypothetical protein